METRRVLVDTSILIDYFRKKNKEKTYLWTLTNSDSKLCISVLTEFEFFCGCSNGQRKNEAKELLSFFSKIVFTSNHCIRASEIYIELRLKNQLIDIIDILIAGVASFENIPLATLNQKHFSRINDLVII